MMRKTMVLAATASLVFGCTTTGSMTGFKPEASEAQRYIAKMRENGDTYVDCLFANALYQKNTQGKIDRGHVVGECRDYEREYYKSSFYAAFGYPNTAHPDSHRHATARTDILNAQNIVIKGFKP